MEKYRAIAEGYMRIGELAKKANVSVNTLRHYDKEGLLSPSAESEGGYRLYTDKDLAMLMQILTMKALGFTLGEIKKRIVVMDTAADVVDALTEHATNIRGEVKRLTESLNAMEALKAEILQMNRVDFKKFAYILANLQMKNKLYWMLKHIDDDVLDNLTGRMDVEAATKAIGVTNRLISEAVKHHKNGTPPGSEKGQEFAKRYWESLLLLVDGDVDMLQKLGDAFDKNATNDNENMKQAHEFIGAALEIYHH